jgi:hypothetical protein
MGIIGPWHHKQVLIIARTYPTPARRGVEVSCTGGITETGEWIRLFPVPYRFLSLDKRFRKYQWVEVYVAKSSDPRPESFQIDIDSIKIISGPLTTRDKWQARKNIIYPLKSSSLCSLQLAREANKYPTLGIFKPKSIHGFDIEPSTPDWTPVEREKLLQYSIFEKATPHVLEKIPYNFSYRFTCDHPNCTGHKLTCVDWELGQAYRQWRQRYGDKWEQAIRERFETYMILERDTHFFAGTVHAHPGAWIIIGLFYPPP